jgi:hypothetical protein
VPTKSADIYTILIKREFTDIFRLLERYSKTVENSPVTTIFRKAPASPGAFLVQSVSIVDQA